MKVFHGGVHPSSEHEIIGTTGDDYIYAQSNGHPGNQIHIFSLDGNDTIKLSMKTDMARQVSHGQHVFGGAGKDTFIFADLNQLKGTIIGRLDDFNPTEDRIVIGNQVLDLNDPAAIKGYKVSFVFYTDPLNVDRIGESQQWILIETNSGGRALYALEGARRNPGPVFAEEDHFLNYSVKVPKDMPSIAFEDPINFLPGYIVDKYNMITGNLKRYTLNSETIYGTKANDAIDGQRGDDLIFGGRGDDLIYGYFGDDTIYGGPGNDAIEGGKGRDSLFGNDGNDIISGGSDDDYIRGGAGNDTIFGGSENDMLFGDSGNDYIDGGTGNDTIYGGQGNDKLLGKRGNDLIFGGDGRDTVYGGEGNDTVYGGRGDDTIYGDSGNDSLFGGDGRDYILGGDGNDSIYGGRGNDRIFGQRGNDFLFGGSGDDTVYGGAGNDTIVGGPGADILKGGSGADVFVFVAVKDSGFGANADTILDFERGLDKLDLQQIDANTSLAGNQDFQFSGINEMPYSVWWKTDLKSGTMVYGDVNGDGVADFSIKLEGVKSLGVDDFIL